jgi:hypothetical protein
VKAEATLNVSDRSKIADAELSSTEELDLIDRKFGIVLVMIAMSGEDDQASLSLFVMETSAAIFDGVIDTIVGTNTAHDHGQFM